MGKVWILIIVIIVATGGYYLFMGNKSTSPAPEETMTPAESMAPAESMELMDSDTMEHTIILNEQNESSESGTAVLKEEDGKVVVTLNMTGAPEDVPQPAHIHVGSCPDVGAVSYPLTNVVNGMSETTLDVTLSDLAAKQPLGINVHKSVPEAKVYVSCGDLAL